MESAETTVLNALKSKRDRWGDINVTMIELGEVTGFGRTKLSQTIGKLRLSGIVDVTRTKRNYGKLYTNRYRIVERTSTASNNDLTSQTTKLTKVLNTSYLIGGKAANEEENMVNRWDDGDDIGGFGLFEDEMNKQPVVSKRDPKTRHKRPQEEWTSADVASEFASQLYAKVRGIPGLVNVAKLRPVLAKYRKEYGTTAVLELEVLDMMMGDERKLSEVKKAPHEAYRIFLRMLTTHNQKAHTNLGIPEVEEEYHAPFVYASDGKAFDNSMPGRAALERYEEKLKN